jgi:hypothetical protein
MMIRHGHYDDYDLDGSAPYRHVLGAVDLNKSLELDVSTKSESWHNVKIHCLAAWAKNETLRKTAFSKLRISLASDDFSLDAFIALVKIVFDLKTSEALDKRGYVRKLFATCGVFWHIAWSEDKPGEYEIFAGRQTEYGLHLERALENEEAIRRTAKYKVPTHIKRKLQKIRDLNQSEREAQGVEGELDGVERGVEESIEATPSRAIGPVSESDVAVGDQDALTDEEEGREEGDEKDQDEDQGEDEEDEQFAPAEVTSSSSDTAEDEEVSIETAEHAGDAVSATETPPTTSDDAGTTANPAVSLSNAPPPSNSHPPVLSSACSNVTPALVTQQPLPGTLTFAFLPTSTIHTPSIHLSSQTRTSPIKASWYYPKEQEYAEMGNSEPTSGRPAKRPRLEIEDAVNKEVEETIVAIVNKERKNEWYTTVLADVLRG